MHTAERPANLLGAAALTVSDLVLAAASKATTLNASCSAALVVLAASPGLSVTELGRRVGLGQSATTRLVDSMEAAGLVRRTASVGRSVAIGLTAAGRHNSTDLLGARGAALTELMTVLDDDEQDLLATLLGKLLARLYEQVGSAELICRLCDRDSCTSHAVCPVGQAEREHGR